MRLLQCDVKNFGSYKELSINFANIGLGLIFGRTGSGKSTIPDLPCWIMFGQTAKDGAVDEVRSWTSPGEPTTGALEIETSAGLITVVRTRGKSSENDLYWLEDGQEQPKRGKDLVETQKLLNKRLGVDAELYLSAAYFSEFSPTSTFFLAKAKDRRAVFERVANLDFPVTLAEKASAARKETKKATETAQTEYDKATGRKEQLILTLASANDYLSTWGDKQKKIIEELTARAANFETEKASKIESLKTKSDRFDQDKGFKMDDLMEKMDALENALLPAEKFDKDIEAVHAAYEAAGKERCPTCAGPVASHKREELMKKRLKLCDSRAENNKLIERFESGRKELKSLDESKNPYLAQLEEAKDAVNQYHEQLDKAKATINPFIAQVNKAFSELGQAATSVTVAKKKVEMLEAQFSSLTQLYDLSFELRGELLKQSVRRIQDSTNDFLENYFDAELRVAFTIEGSDSLEVSIQKSGYACSFKQLSKGQRQLLKLCFSLSIMAASANRAGVNFANLFLDEALDGLDVSLKLKAFRLFERLETEHETVLVIDHSEELKSLFTKHYQATIESDISTLSEVEN